MATAQTEVESQIIELSEESFDTFCNDMSGMFGIEMICNQQDICTETVKNVKKRFKKLVAICSVKSEGALNGSFKIIFDQEGLFTLGGVIVMLPEKKILENAKKGTDEDAENSKDAISEAGNLLVGAWDRVFRDKFEDHGHFAQTNTFIGFIAKPGLRSKETIGLEPDEEIIFVPHQMTIGSYPTFECGVIFPKTIFGETADTAAEQPENKAEQDTQQQPPVEQQAESKDTETAKDTDTAPPNNEDKQNAQEPAEEKSHVPQEPAQEKTDAAAEEQKTEKPQPQEPSADESQNENPQTADTSENQQAEPKEQENQETTDEPTAEKTDQQTPETNETESAEQEETQAQTDTTEQTAESNENAPTRDEQQEQTNQDNKTENKDKPISETIKNMTESPADLPGDPAPVTAQSNSAGSDISLNLKAADFMQKEVAWATPEDSVQQTLEKMQQHNTGYIMVGKDGVLEGIVSKSNIAGAISPYLRPIFAKWRRPLDDTTLQIKTKWIMTKPVKTIKLETTLLTITENMSQSGYRALPVTDQNGKVQGLVTVFDIFKTFLKDNQNISTTGNAPQTPPLA